jgi:hypothetical protein
MAFRNRRDPDNDTFDDHPEPEDKKKKKDKSRKPPNTAFRQQRLKAWQPILTTKTVIIIYFVFGIVFMPIGGLLLWANSLVCRLGLNLSPKFTC